MVLSKYEEKTGHSLGEIQVDLVVGTTIRAILFMFIPLKANYDLLLGREWIHGVGAIPYSLNHRISLWREDSIVENVEADQSYYWMK